MCPARLRAEYELKEAASPCGPSLENLTRSITAESCSQAPQCPGLETDLEEAVEDDLMAWTPGKLGVLGFRFCFKEKGRWL